MKKKVKKALKNSLKEAAENIGGSGSEEEEEEEEINLLEELHRFSSCWKGFYKQFGRKQEVECMHANNRSGWKYGWPWK